MRLRQNGRHFADDIFKCISLNENFQILNKISLNHVPSSLIDNMKALVQIMVWRQTGDKPLSEPMMGSVLKHICVTRPQWVKRLFHALRVIQNKKAHEVKQEFSNNCLNAWKSWSLTHCGLVMQQYGNIQISVNTGSGNGLLPDSAKPLPESMFDISSVRFCSIHLSAISQEKLKISILYAIGNY